jgi:N-terminal helicase PWI domain
MRRVHLSAAERHQHTTPLPQCHEGAQTCSICATPPPSSRRLDYQSSDQSDVITKFLKNRDVVIWCTKLARSDADERVDVEVAMCERPRQCDGALRRYAWARWYQGQAMVCCAGRACWYRGWATRLHTVQGRTGTLVPGPGNACCVGVQVTRVPVPLLRRVHTWTAHGSVMEIVVSYLYSTTST